MANERVYRTSQGEILSTTNLATGRTVDAESSPIPRHIEDDYERFMAAKRRDQKQAIERTNTRSRLRKLLGLGELPQTFTSSLAERLWNTEGK